MKKLTYILFFLIQFTVLINGEISSSEFVIRNWGLDDGLRTNRIIKIESDKDGFLWMATDNGLTRFDGYKFVTFNKQNTKIIKDNYIANIFSDNGNICFTASKNYLIKIVNGVFKKAYPDTLLVKDIVFRKTIFYENRRWILTHDGIFTLTDNQIIPQKTFYGISSNRISTFTVDQKGYLWLAINNDGIYQYRNGSFKRKFVFKNRIVRRFYFDTQNRLWIASKEGIVVIKNKKEITKRVIGELSRKLLKELKEDKFGNIWIATSRSGLFLLDKENNLTHITKKEGLFDESITGIKIIDEDVWISTLNSGLFLINKAKVKVIDKSLGLSSQYVNAFFNDTDGSILIGTIKGIFRVNDNYNNLGRVSELKFLNDKHIYVINRDKEGNLLVGTRLFGLYIVKKNEIINYNINNKLRSNFVRAIYVDNSNRIYVGTNSGGITILSADTTKHITKNEGLSNDLIAFIHKAKDGKLWVGTSGGGVNILSQDRVIKVLDVNNGLKGNVVSSIYEDSNGIIWLSINKGGLARIEGNRIDSFTTEEGLFTNKLLNIAGDMNNLLWFTTPSGIFSIRKEDIQKKLKGEIALIGYNLYGKADGMPVERCTGASKQTAIISQKGNLFVSTSRGAVVINTKNIFPTKNKLKVFVDKITVDDKIVNRENYMSLPKDFKKIEFSFGAIDFRNSHYLKIYYKLNGIDSDWRDAGKSRSVSYSYIPFGTYKFEVKTNNTSENHKIEHAQVLISIPPHFWEVRLFQVLAFFLFVAIVVGITKYINTQKYKRRLHLLELEQALEKERIRISKDMHDEVGANLTKMSLLGEIAKKYVNDSEKLEHYLNQITTTGVEVASSLDELVWTVNPKNDKLNRLIAYIVRFVDDFLSSTEIKFNFLLPEEIPETYISAELRHAIFSVLKEAINNSVKHSQCEIINLNISLDNKKLTVIVEDNGKGFDFDKVGEFSNGLNNMKSRIENVNGSFNIFKAKPSGVGIKFIIDI